jgi:hypothetical protein
MWRSNYIVCCRRLCIDKYFPVFNKNSVFQARYLVGHFPLFRLIFSFYLFIVMTVLLQGQASAQRQALVPPQTVADIEFTVRAASLEMISPGAANGAAPTARFSIAITNRNKSSIGLVIDAAASGASTDTGLDLRSYNNSVSHGLRICEPCRNVPDSEWIILQPSQTDNIVIALYTRVAEPQRHRNAETADLTLILLIKEGTGDTTQAVLSLADIPIRNELK